MKLGTQTALLTISQYGCAPAMPERNRFEIFGSEELEYCVVKDDKNQPSEYLIEEIKSAIKEQKKNEDHDETF